MGGRVQEQSAALWALYNFQSEAAGRPPLNARHRPVANQLALDCVRFYRDWQHHCGGPALRSKLRNLSLNGLQTLFSLERVRRQFFYHHRLGARTMPIPSTQNDPLRCPTHLGPTEEFIQIARCLRLAKIEALNFGAAYITKLSQLFFGFDALRSDGHTQVCPKRSNRPHDRQGVISGIHVVNERAIYFDLVELEAAEVTQAGISSSKIIESNTDPDISELPQRFLGTLGILQKNC